MTTAVPSFQPAPARFIEDRPIKVHEHCRVCGLPVLTDNADAHLPQHLVCPANPLKRSSDGITDAEFAGLLCDEQAKQEK